MMRTAMLSLALAGSLLATATPQTANLSLVVTTTENRRFLSLTYLTPHKAPAGATASLDLPAGLGLGPSARVEVMNTLAVSGGETTVLRYWGSGDRVARGQPVAEKRGTPGKGSTGSGDETLERIPTRGKAAGQYVLHTSYTKPTSLTLGAGQDFLPPIRLTAPARADLSKPIALSWTRIPRATGYSVHVAGYRKGQTVMWEAVKDGTRGWHPSATGPQLKSGRLLPADQTRCTIPGGIFQDTANVTVTAYSSEVHGKGAMNALGWAQSTTTATIRAR